jgi:N-acyl-D-aspartate/D-glutamate deacylase
MLERLGDRSVRDRLRADIAARGHGSFGHLPSWDAVRVAISPNQPEHAGQTIGEIARARGLEPLDAACEYLVADEGHTRVIMTAMAEDDVREILQSPSVLIGSDGTALAPYGVTGQGKPHPRYYGTFPRVLGHYVRELGLLSLPEAIRKMTGASAAALGLVKRGLIQEGFRADLASSTRRKSPTWPLTTTHRYAAGVVLVIVNGTVVIDAGEHTGALPGQVLRRGPRGVA